MLSFVTLSVGVGALVTSLCSLRVLGLLLSLSESVVLTLSL